jgi:DNA-binding response OmpR family regulator
MSKQNPPHILIVEDETISAFLLKEHLKVNGFTAKICNDGEEGWRTLQHERFDIIILDVNMPKMDGYELASHIREKDSLTPIIFVTANTAQQDKLKGFELGGDEYITKPYSAEELVARMHVILKRMKPQPTQHIGEKELVMQVGNCKIDFTNQHVYIGQIEKRFSATEGQLLRLFVENKNELMPRNAILLNIWGRDDYYTARNLDVYINKIRKLIKDDATLEIVNIHGSGFKLLENSSAT